MSDLIFFLLTDSKNRKCTSASLDTLLEKADEWISNNLFELSLLTGPTIRFEIFTEKKDNDTICKYIQGKHLNSMNSYFQSEYNLQVEKIENV